MQVIIGNNVNTLFIDGLWWLKTSGVKEESRNGEVIALPTPITSCYSHPWERVLFHPERDANPYFHLMEGIWMLAGDGNLTFLTEFNKRMEEFSDDKFVLNGAYGYRWRSHFERDQLQDIVEMLRKDPNTRRAVLGMWDPLEDLASTSKDIPCNTHCYFRILQGRLDMTVCCRSNDAVWGAYGANAVHFSMMHEYVARAVDIPQGWMYQVSNNLHIYPIHYHLLRAPAVLNNLYGVRSLVVPMIGHNEKPEDFLKDCEAAVAGELLEFRTTFFTGIIAPALTSWYWHKAGNRTFAQSALEDMPLCDWRMAMEQWLNRRYK